jgi:4-hydroxybenzoate polyprenyltransferase
VTYLPGKPFSPRDVRGDMSALARRATGLLRATHPLPALAVTTIVSVVAASRGARGLTLTLVILSTGAGQASVGWSNDFLDRDRDRVTGRTDKPLVAGDVEPRTVLAGALVAFPLSVGLSVPLGFDAAVVMLVAVASAWLYNAILKSTWRSWVPYAVSFGLAPVYIWLATTDSLPPMWIGVGAALLGVAAHLLNVIPDLESDRRTEVLGLPHRLGLRRSLLLACAVLGGVLVLVLAATAPPVVPQVVAAVIAAGLIVAVAWAGFGGRGRLGFRLTIASAAAIVAVFLLSPSASRL